ncbi:uncharacterized protein BX664DRAFT_341423 [Halteromyces radiatus]|uniref:uncharacterized protein n=1 Tax=Halteromyces radiatus TaxID=101107 RepID=UPI0022204D38|nr:uncharacterized protein BX664DRAFT_341423 [Halteromyces radiatus]KAI8079773.1 hypothetical protein BX664DRAFT_341423 [Halteromyces radiatus]
MTDMDQQLEQVASEIVNNPTAIKETTSDDTKEETLDDILSRHRAEERDLNNKIIGLRKTIPKNNKAKKREMTSRISDMEYHLKQKQQLEIRQYHAKQKGLDPNSLDDDNDDDGISLDTLNRLKVEEDPIAPSSSPTVKPMNATPSKKPNRAKLKKERREQEMQRLREEAEKEAENQVDMGQLEIESIRELLVPMKLRVQEITADGHCLYNAIGAQLEKRYNEKETYQDLRKQTAKYMRQHPDDFIPFLYKDNGDLFSADDFEMYCNDIESTARWGGQLEILALSNIKQVPIHVIQMGAPVIKVNDEIYQDKQPLKLAYHKHLYSLGAHYNSLLDI